MGDNNEIEEFLDSMTSKSLPNELLELIYNKGYDNCSIINRGSNCIIMDCTQHNTNENFILKIVIILLLLYYFINR